MGKVSRRQIDQRRGLAILTTLLVIALLLGLLSAFLVVNRAGNRLTVNSVERRQAQDAALTAFDYARYSLEKDRLWADRDTPLSGSDQFPFVSPIAKFNLGNNADGDGFITGEYSPSRDFASPLATVEMTVRNNLKSKTELAASVPKRAVNIRVVAKVGGVTRVVEGLLRPQVQSHESLAAGRDIDLSSTAGLTRFESKDPYVNRVRAGSDLFLPPNSDVRFLKHGEAASTDRLRLGSQSLESASDAAVIAAGDISGGNFLTNAPSGFTIADFDDSELDLPSQNESLPAGEWRFGDAVKVEYISHNLSYARTGPMGVPLPPGQVQRYQKKSSTYNILTAPNGQKYAAGTAIVGTTVFDPPFPPAGFYPSEGAASSYGLGAAGPGGYGDTGAMYPESDVHTLTPGVEANVVTAQMVIHPGKNIQLSGDFIVTADGSRSPELYFGYDLSPGGVATQTALVNGIEAAKDSPSTYMASIEANGDVNVTGGLLGYGSIIAGGDVTIKASSGLRAAPDLGVLVKGNNIIINAATEPEPALPGEPINVDYAIYRSAIVAESGGDWTQYNNWLDHDAATRGPIITNLKTQSSGATASSHWATFNAEIGGGGPYPASLLSSWPGGNINLGQYMRLKEYYQTVATGYNDGDGDVTLLNLSSREDDVSGRIQNVLNGIAQWAESYKKTFQAYLDSPDPGLPDMFIEGLLYADDSIIVNASGKSVRLEGAVVAKTGDIKINGASKAEAIYDRELVDNLYSAGGTGPMLLEKVFMTFE